MDRDPTTPDSSYPLKLETLCYHMPGRQETVNVSYYVMNSRNTPGFGLTNKFSPSIELCCFFFFPLSCHLPFAGAWSLCSSALSSLLDKADGAAIVWTIPGSGGQQKELPGETRAGSSMLWPRGHTHTLQFTAHWPDLVSQAVKKVNTVVCQKAGRQHAERKHNDYHSFII